jgi:cobalt/nickel transport system ATP-binding protein
LFTVHGLGFRYGELSALQGIDLAFQPGDRIALLGSNGSGKSTLLRILDGLIAPSAGHVYFNGTELNDRSLSDDEYVIGFRRRVALLFQDPDVQLFNPTVFDEVAFGPLQLRWPREEIRHAVEHVLALLEIGHLKDRAPHRLSGGEKKRVALASILVLDPEVLLLDEPTAALDPRSQSQLIDFLRHLPAGKMVITATHDLETVEHIAGYCYVLSAGEVVAQGTPPEILGNRELLESVNLVYAHTHSGSERQPHFHPHLPGSH